jgi:hypothetical protein
VILWRLADLGSSSSGAFFFLLPPVLLAPLDVGWLDSRVGNEDVGVWACEGVVCADPGVEDS